MLERPDAGDAGIAGDAGRTQRMLAGMLATVRVDLHGIYAGNAEEELGVQQSTSAVYPTSRVALALRARRHTAQMDFDKMCMLSVIGDGQRPRSQFHSNSVLEIKRSLCLFCVCF